MFLQISYCKHQNIRWLLVLKPSKSWFDRFRGRFGLPCLPGYSLPIKDWDICNGSWMEGLGWVVESNWGKQINWILKLANKQSLDKSFCRIFNIIQLLKVGQRLELGQILGANNQIVPPKISPVSLTGWVLLGLFAKWNKVGQLTSILLVSHQTFWQPVDFDFCNFFVPPNFQLM